MWKMIGTAIPRATIPMSRAEPRGKLEDVGDQEGCIPNEISRAKGKLDDVDDRNGSLRRDTVLVRIVHKLHVRLPPITLERLSLSCAVAIASREGGMGWGVFMSCIAVVL